MSLRAFNSIQGFSVGENPSQDIILANGDITTVNFTANGVSNLGPIGNVKITGGSAGQTIVTDGNGNLSFTAIGGNSAAIMPYLIPSDKSYIVPVDFQGLFTQPIDIEGQLEIDGILIEVGTPINAKSRQVLFDSEGQITGNIGFTFDQSSGNLGIPGNINVSGNITPVVDFGSSLGNATNRWKDLYLSGNTIYIGNSSISTSGGNLTLTNGQGGQIVVAGNNVTTSNEIVNQDSNLFVNANSVTISVNNTPNVGLFSTAGLTVTGVVSATGNAIVDGILTDNYYYANGQPIDTQNPSGSNTQVQYNSNNNFGASSNFTFDSSANLLSIGGNVSVTKNLQLSSNSAISINNSVGNAGQVLTSNGNTTTWATNFYYGDTPPDFATLNYGDIFFFIDTPNSTQRLYMWVTDGSSDYFYDFLPPSF